MTRPHYSFQDKILLPLSLVCLLGCFGFDFSFKFGFVWGQRLQGQRAPVKGQGDEWDQNT